MVKLKLMVPGAGGVKEPVQRTEKLLLETPCAGAAPFQSKSMWRSMRWKAALPAKPEPLKYSADSPTCL